MNAKTQYNVRLSFPVSYWVNKGESAYFTVYEVVPITSNLVLLCIDKFSEYMLI